MILHVTIDSSTASYQITPEVDGIYRGKLLNKVSGPHNQLPEQIILIKTNGGWSSDHSPKELGLILGDKIDDYEKNA